MSLAPSSPRPARAGIHPAGPALGALHLALAAAQGEGWVFAKYPHLAEALARGALTPEQAADASPAYLLLAAALSPEALRWLQLLLAAAAVALLFEVLRRAAGPVAAWAGGLTLALARPWLVYPSVLEPEVALGAASLVAVACLLAGPGRRALLGAGLALGVAAALRPTALLWAALLLPWALSAGAPPRRVLLAALVGLGVAALPALALKATVGSDPRGTMSAGQPFHQGHRPESVGLGASPPTLLKLVEAEAGYGPHPPDLTHDLYREVAALAPGTSWAGRVGAWLAAYPWAAARQQLWTLAFSLAPPEPETDVPGALPLLADAPGLSLRALAWLGLGGLLVGLVARRTRPLAVLGLQWATAVLVAQLFYFQGRYAVWVVPALAALGGLGLQAVAERWPGRQGAALALLALLVSPAGLRWLPPVRHADRVLERLAAADAVARRPVEGPDRWAQALQRYVESQAAFPDVFWPAAPRGAGLLADEPDTAARAAERAEAVWGVADPVDATLAAGLWAAAGRCPRALELAGAARGFAWAFDDAVVDPLVVAADCLLHLGQRGEALARLEAANREAPGRLEVLARLVAAGDTGERTELARWEAELRAFHDPFSARWALARARRRWGDPQGALADADWVLARWPAAAAFAQVERARDLLALGRGTEAAQAWGQGLALHAPLHGLEELDGLAAAALSADPRAAPLVLRHFALRGARAKVRALVRAHPELEEAAEVPSAF